ncbi:MAG: adenylosuccinate lyase, partial [Nitrososphaerales archaeon]
VENLEHTKGQIYAEFVLNALVRKGMPRLHAYRAIQRTAFGAEKKDAHFLDALLSDRDISSKLKKEELKLIFNPKNHLAASGQIIDNVTKVVKQVCRA